MNEGVLALLATVGALTVIISCILTCIEIYNKYDLFMNKLHYYKIYRDKVDGVEAIQCKSCGAPNILSERITGLTTTERKGYKYEDE